MTHGTWYSRLTMPMCDCGVPERHTTAVSSSKIGARNVAPASATHATTPSARRVHQLEHVVGRRQPPPRAAHRRRLEHPGPGPDIPHRRWNVAAAVRRYDLGRARADEAMVWSCTRSACGASSTVDETDVVVAHLIEAGLVVRAAPGRPRHAGGPRRAHRRGRASCPGSDDEAAVRRAYERFLPLNRELIRVCNDWQVRPGGVPNDHRDPRYDWSVIDRLRALDERVAPVIYAARPRAVRASARYRPRLRAALARVDDGEHEWLTSPRIDSYHTVWMQLHEDLLLALGADRSDESES